MAELGKILKGIDVVSVKGSADIQVTGISFDSRSVSAGNIFVAVRGTSSDGHNYISDAISSGAVAVICEEIPADRAAGVTWITTASASKALALAASNFYDNPSSKMKLVGVTGTNGKTTVATLLYRLYMKMGYPSGLFSTVANYINGSKIPATHTTPDPVQLNRIMADMVDAGCEYAFMEVSSHAVAQDRTYGLHFAGGIFTNLTHDHLDYHGTFSNYLAAKKRFFDTLPESSFALVNGDDRNGSVMVQNCRASVSKYALRSMADYKGKVIENRMEGMLIRIGNHDLLTRFVGEYNGYNLMAVYGAAMNLGADSLDTLTAISGLAPVEGRLEVINSPEGKRGIVDYAHTPDALANVISTLNQVRDPGTLLITVVGAGGDRDKTKRPEMARVSAEGSDRVIITSDNPRSEDPEKIIDDMMSGLDPVAMNRALRIPDRREAIRTAVMLARAGDIILVAGKGHETYQEVKGKRSHFDDREELAMAFGINRN
ncbi:MAG: UDP-N-acetylmuramoyl-L-alanyl-D-glutamate--2,6-diaminopimelate ligase [Bacteroidales bacterium]